MFTAAVFIIPKKWKQSKFPSADEEIDKTRITTQWTIVWPYKGMNYMTHATAQMNLVNIMFSERS